jgi:transcriptional regulator with XRE-family HTH domain
MTLGEKIALERKERNWTQSKLGDQIDVSRELIGKYERGDIQPPLDVITRIAVTLNLSLDYLVGIKEDNPTTEKESGIKELTPVLNKLKKLSKAEKAHVEAVIDAFFDRAQLKQQ